VDFVWYSRLSGARGSFVQRLQQICRLVSFVCLNRPSSVLIVSQSLRWSLGILIFEMLCGFTPFWDGGSPVKIYENILKGRVKYPPYIHHDAQDLLVQLITPDLTKRLGNLHAGPADVKNHPWFAEVTWERLLKKDIDAPYVPPVKGGQGDASQYDKYPEETEEYGKKGDDP
jgi:protein kinase A